MCAQMVLVATVLTKEQEDKTRSLEGLLTIRLPEGGVLDMGESKDGVQLAHNVHISFGFYRVRSIGGRLSMTTHAGNSAFHSPPC